MPLPLQKKKEKKRAGEREKKKRIRGVRFVEKRVRLPKKITFLWVPVTEKRKASPSEKLTNTKKEERLGLTPEGNCAGRPHRGVPRRSTCSFQHCRLFAPKPRPSAGVPRNFETGLQTQAKNTRKYRGVVFLSFYLPQRILYPHNSAFRVLRKARTIARDAARSGI